MLERHFTTRRGFITALGFSAVSLYGAWAAYGAAPLPFGGHTKAADPHTANPHASDAHGGGHEMAMAPEPGGHSGHGAAPASPPAVFHAEHEAFLSQYRRADGSVDPHAMNSMHGHDAHAMHAHGDDSAPVDVYLLAKKWGYDPETLHLRAGTPYRFRMMADDITHGASIQMGAASRIIRLRPNIVTEQTLTFTKPGEYLVYCTVYCGQAHDAMQGRIIVA